MTYIQPELYVTFFNQAPLTTTAAVPLADAPGAGLKYQFTDIQVSNASATASVVHVLSGSTIIWVGFVPGLCPPVNIGLAVPRLSGANEAVTAKCLTAGAAVYLTLTGTKLKGTGVADGQVPLPPAYSPADFFTGATVGFSYLFDTPGANLLNGSGGNASNGQTVATAKSAVGTADATQATDTGRPTLVTNAVNGLAAVECDGGDQLDVSAVDAFLNAATSVTVGVVWRPTDFAANHHFLEQETTAYNPRLTCRLNGDQTTLDYNPTTGANGNDQYSGGLNALTAGVYAAVLFQVDASNRTVAMYANNATFRAPVQVTGPAQAFVNGGGSSRLFRNAKGRCPHVFLAKNALMTTQQRADWFAAMKTRYALTAY